MHPAAAHNERRDPQPRPDIQPAGALRAHQPLVPGEAEHVDAEGLHVDGQAPRRLGSVHDQQKAVLFCHLRHKGQVGGMAGHIRCPGDDDRSGVGPDQLLELLVPQNGAVVHPHKAELHPLFPQAVEGPQHRIVLADRRNDMVAGRKQPADGGVERLGGVGRKGDAGRVLRVEELCQRRARVVNDAGRVKGRFMCPASGVARRLQSRKHRLPHHRRLLQRGGGMIEVDHGLTTFPAFSIFSAMTYIFVTVPMRSFSVRP